MKSGKDKSATYPYAKPIMLAANFQASEVVRTESSPQASEVFFIQESS